MKTVFAFLSLFAAAFGVQAGPIEKRASQPFQWGSEKIRGVNIGGWLVLEPWITPSVFTSLDQNLGIVDEFTLCERLPGQAPDILRRHWNSWIKFDDFARIASAGFNMVRLPIGYWAYDNSGSPYVKGAADYLDAAIDWARGTGLRIMIDIHGQPGSQNGFDNSGQRLNPSNLKFLRDGAYGQTGAHALRVISQIAAKYAKDQYKDVVMGIELVNEPMGWQINAGDLFEWYRAGYNNIREHGDSTVIISDAFKHPTEWNGFLTPIQNAHRVAVDHHEYQVFDNGLLYMNSWEHRHHVCNSVGSYSGSDKWSFVGEWTAAMTDCAPFLNGYAIGARFDGTFPGSPNPPIGSCRTKNNIDEWSQGFKDDTRMFIEAQLDMYERATNGWVFWTVKTERAHEWDAFKLIEHGVFPSPVTSRKFPPTCA